MENKGCQYCRRKPTKFGWDQPAIPFGSNPIKVDEEISGNAIEDPETWEARIYDYQTACPCLTLTKKGYFGEDSVGTIYIPIHHCIVCGRRLGKGNPMDYSLESEGDKSE